MCLVLTVDGERWRGHLRTVAEATPGLVPVAKGNGYGFTLGRLARQARPGRCRHARRRHLRELPHVANRFDGTGWSSPRGAPSTPAPTPAVRAGGPR